MKNEDDIALLILIWLGCAVFTFTPLIVLGVALLL